MHMFARSGWIFIFFDVGLGLAMARFVNLIVRQDRLPCLPGLLAMADL
jgi:hypothetical protein